MAQPYLTEPPSPPARPRRTAILVTIAIVVPIALVVAVLWTAVAIIRYPDIDSMSISDRIGSKGIDATAEICDDIGCEEARRTDYGTFLQFRSDGIAEYWAQVIGGDTLRSGRVVLDRNGLSLSLSDRSISVDMLYPNKDWD